MQTSYTMTEHGKGANPELAIYVYSETCRQANTVADFEDVETSGDCELAYKGLRSDIIAEAQLDAAGRSGQRWAEVAKNVLAYLMAA